MRANLMWISQRARPCVPVASRVRGCDTRRNVSSVLQVAPLRSGRCLPILLALAVALAACTEPRAPVPRLVLVVATCSVNAGFLGPYDDAVETTPFLDEFASESLVFERHYTEAGQSGVAFASIFSGGQADRHGIFYHPQRARDELVWLPEVFGAAGYETHAWLAHGNASARLNYAQGVPRERQRGSRLDGASPEFRAVLERLQRDPLQRALVLTNFTVTHRPYGKNKAMRAFCRAYPGECGGALADPAFWDDIRRFHEDHRRFSYDTEAATQSAGLSAEDMPRFRRHIELLYRSDVFVLDRVLAAIVSAVAEHGLLEESLIAITADHGESMHPEAAFPWTHGYLLSPEVVRVPWILYGPGVGIRPGRYAGVTRSIDVLPTLAGLAGISAEGVNVAGLDLSRAVRGEDPPPAITAQSHTSMWSDAEWDAYRHWGGFHARYPVREPELMWVSAATEEWFFRLHRDPSGPWRPEVFDLRSDPYALRNVYRDGDPEQQAKLLELRRYHERLVHAFRNGSDAPLDPTSEAEILRSLGYIR